MGNLVHTDILIQCLNCEKLAWVELFDGRSLTKIVM